MPPWDKYAAVTPQASQGRPWAKYGEAAPAALQGQPQGISDALANAFGQGATMNFGDELTALVRSKFPELSDWMMKGSALQRAPEIGGAPAPQTVSGAPTEDQRYGEELAKVRAQTAADAAANPVAMGAANIAGNVAGSAPLLAAAPSALTTMGPSLLANAAKVGGVGSLLGGVTGFGAGEGGLENRAASSVIPAAAGLALGTATPFAGAAARAGFESAPGRALVRNTVDPIANYLMRGASEGAESVVQGGALQRLVTAAQRGRINPSEAQASMETLGPGAMPADVNKQFTNLAETMHTLPGQTQSLAPQVLNDRYLGAPQRMTAALEGNQPPPSAFQLRGEGQAFDQNISNVGRTAYQGDMVDAGLTQSPELRAMLDNPTINKAIETVLSVDKASRIGRPDAPPLTPIEVMQRVKQMVEGQGFREGTAIPGPNMQSFRDLAGDFTGTLKRDNPALAAADRAYSEAKSLPEFFDRGASALGKSSATESGIERSAPAIADLLHGATPNQALSARVGLVNAARSQAQEGSQETLALAKRLMSSRPLQEKVAALTSPEEAANIVRQAGAEQTFQATNKRITGGSDTARRLSNTAEDDLGNAQLRIDPRGITTRAVEKIGDILKNVTAPNEAVRDEIGRLLLNPSAPQNRELMQRLAIALQQRRSGVSTRAGIAAGGANQAREVLQ